MSRLIEWKVREVEVDGREPIVDHVGFLGPLRAFTLAQHTDKVQWELTSHFIPSKKRGKIYRDPEIAKRDCQEIVQGFANWLAG